MRRVDSMRGARIVFVQGSCISVGCCALIQCASASNAKRMIMAMLRINRINPQYGLRKNLVNVFFCFTPKKLSALGFYRIVDKKLQITAPKKKILENFSSNRGVV